MKDHEIYADYLTHRLDGRPLKKILEKHNCTRQHIYNVRNRIEKAQVYPMNEHAREANWDFKYEPIFQNCKEKGTLHALIRHMYFDVNYSIDEIAFYTTMSKEAVKVILFR